MLDLDILILIFQILTALIFALHWVKPLRIGESTIKHLIFFSEGNALRKKFLLL